MTTPSGNSIRVLAVNHTGLLGGAERSLLAQLARDNDAGTITASVACPKGELSTAAESMGLETVEIRPFEFGFRSKALAIPSALLAFAKSSADVAAACRRSDAAVIHANSPRSALISSWARFALRVPLIAHIRDCMPRTRRGAVVRRLLALCSSAIVANSRFTATDFDPTGRWDVAVVYNLVGEDFVSPDRSRAVEFVDQAGLDSSKLLVGMVGQITPWKGQDLAIRAFADAAAELPQLQLVVVGSAKFNTVGNRHNNRAFDLLLHSIAEEEGVADRVEFVGESTNVVGAMLSFDLVLMPSHEEPFGRVAIEAMASGAAVIATDKGGPVEFIRDGENGLLLAPQQRARWAEAISRLASDQALRERIAAAGRQTVLERFSGAASETQMNPVYKQALRVVR